MEKEFKARVRETWIMDHFGKDAWNPCYGNFKISDIEKAFDEGVKSSEKLNIELVQAIYDIHQMLCGLSFCVDENDRKYLDCHEYPWLERAWHYTKEARAKFWVVDKNGELIKS